MNKCPKCRRPKAEGAKFCRACYAVFPAPGGFTAVSRHNREARIASILMQLFILFIASMAVWLIQADLSFLRVAKERLSQTVTEAKQGARSLINGGNSSSDLLPGDDGSERAVGNEGSGQRCDGACLEQRSSVTARAPSKLVVSVGTSGGATRGAAEIMISGINVCPAGRVCQGTVSFQADTAGEYTIISTSPSSSTLVPADRHASALLRKFSHGTLEVRLGGDRMRTVQIHKQKRGKWTTNTRAKSGSSIR